MYENQGTVIRFQKLCLRNSHKELSRSRFGRIMEFVKYGPRRVGHGEVKKRWSTTHLAVHNQPTESSNGAGSFGMWFELSGGATVRSVGVAATDRV